MEEGIFPGSSAQYEEDELEEERRLCYVAMTRAKERLTLTHARQRMLYGKTASNRVSRFLEEAPEENLNWEGRDLRPGGTFGSSCAGGFYGGGDGSEGVRRPVYARPARPSYQESRRTAVSQTAAPSIALSKGDRIEHGVFGRGTVLSVQPMGGDALVQVDFEGAGQKKLMLKAAAKHLKKLDS